MKKLFALALALVLTSCATGSNVAHNGNSDSRMPASNGDLTGHYLGEGLFQSRSFKPLDRPAMRLYLNRSEGEADTYYAVLVEYDNLLGAMGAQYIAAQKAPIVNKVIGYLNSITTRIWAFKAVPGQKKGTYDFLNLKVQGDQIVAASTPSMVLTLGNDPSKPMINAAIDGYADGRIVFPQETGHARSTEDLLKLRQFDMASIIYRLGHLSSTWRGNWNDLEGSYLSEYGRNDDGVLELYSENGQKKMKFIKTNNTKAKYFTNPKSATIEGDYNVLEPVPKMYILKPAKGTRTASDAEMAPRIGLFLDVFDGSAPEAGSHLVTELAFTNQDDAEDSMMYYEHAQHLKNIGVAPKKK